jgi:peroxiredoxin-like protein
MEPHYYNVNINWKNDRLGNMQSPELNDAIDVATPPQFPKGIEGVWSPEHLFAAAVSSCFMTTFLAIAENSKLEFTGLKIESKGKLEVVDGKYMMTEVDVMPTLTIVHEKDRERAERVLMKSEAACLITNSVKAKVNLKPVIEIAETVLN